MTFTISRTIDVSPKRKIGRNEPCPCGSGKKYKKCCLMKEEAYSPIDNERVREPLVTVRQSDIDMFDQAYMEAFYLMDKHQEFLPALRMYGEIAPLIGTMDEPFRFYNNVAAALMNLGELDLAKRFLKKSLRIEPSYEHGKKSQEAIRSLRDEQGFIRNGKQRLFIALATEGLSFRGLEVSDNPMVSDCISFLSFLSSHRVKLSSVRHDLSRRDMLAVNRRFTHPDRVAPAMRHERDFPTVAFLHTVLFTGRLIREEKRQLLRTRNGYAFLNGMDDTVRFSRVFSAWFGTTDWGKLKRKTKPRGPLGKIFSVVSGWESSLKDVSFSVLLLLKENRTHPIAPADLLGKTDVAANDISPTLLFVPILERIFLRHLAWAGIISAKPIREKRSRFSMLPTIETIQLTDFGCEVIEAIEYAMESAIPKNIREMV